jgi:hypothetical protein
LSPATARASDRRNGTIDHTPEAVAVWAAELRLRFGGQPIRGRSGTVARALGVYADQVRAPGHFSCSPDCPGELSKKFSALRAKDDPSDAGLPLDILMLHRDKLRQLDLDTSETRTLQFLVEERRKLDTLFKSAYRASEDVLPSGARLVR